MEKYDGMRKVIIITIISVIFLLLNWINWIQYESVILNFIIIPTLFSTIVLFLVLAELLVEKILEYSIYIWEQI